MLTRTLGIMTMHSKFSYHHNIEPSSNAFKDRNRMGFNRTQSNFDPVARTLYNVSLPWPALNIFLHDLDSCAQSSSVKVLSANTISDAHDKAARASQGSLSSLVKKARASQTATVLDHPPHSRKSLAQIDLRMADFVFRGLHPASANPPLSTCASQRGGRFAKRRARALCRRSRPAHNAGAGPPVIRFRAIRASHYEPCTTRNARPSPTRTADLRPPSAARLPRPPELARAQINLRWPRDLAALRLASQRKSHAAGGWPARMRSPPPDPASTEHSARSPTHHRHPGTMRVPANPSARQRERLGTVGARRPAQRRRRGSAPSARDSPLRSAAKREDVVTNKNSESRRWRREGRGCG
ncbi:hypothetical protein DFH06DRAFT_1477437 [Mycena polygramma]|nr:hypothetical protein DFH06DRAFT_1477437 [Mycena polygramma]